MSEKELEKKVKYLNKLIAKVDKNKKKIEKNLGKTKRAKELKTEVLSEIKLNQKLIKDLKKELNTNNSNKSNKSYKQKGNNVSGSKREREVDNIIFVMEKALEYQKKIFKLIKSNNLI